MRAAAAAHAVGANTDAARQTRNFDQGSIRHTLAQAMASLRREISRQFVVLNEFVHDEP